MSRSEWRPDFTLPAITGSTAAVIGVGALVALGGISDWKGLALLEATLPTTRFLCAALITSSATILALMLTILSLGAGSEVKLNRGFYRSIRRIARLDTVAFVGAVLFLLLISIPLVEGDNVPTGWYDIVYYVTIGISCLLAGLVVTIVTMLYQAIDAAIVVLGYGAGDHPLLQPDDDQAEASTEAA
ncbi:MAG: hypothetical protein DWQ36_20030 [Acidobacteria bacterium]|nr:MAG: hypothetical protein DWQ30_08335 [Acidobacteriota bacterium]REK03578.1 MAG: hypothetical protein DWQ36_20030 [Acidobacteriota bacterium]